MEKETHTYTLILSSEVQTEPINFSLHAFVSFSCCLSSTCLHFAAVQLVSHLLFSGSQFSTSCSHTFHKNYRIYFLRNAVTNHQNSKKTKLTSSFIHAFHCNSVCTVCCILNMHGPTPYHISAAFVVAVVVFTLEIHTTQLFNCFVE